MTRGLLVAAVAAVLALGTFSADAKDKQPKQHYANEGGHYAGGKGSSHEGGHYKNAHTHDHYTKHKKS
jgi:hypothetical protein